MTETTTATPTAARSTKILAEIQALRAVAVLLVVLFHLWPNQLPGGYIGVDVFFVISGFLITSHILRDLERGTFKLHRFWGRRIRRLLPASLLVLGVVAIAIMVWAPQVNWQQWLREVGASALYVENWVLAADAVDYLAADNTASPVQHFWSLSVEEQFYVVWPLLILAALAIAVLLKRLTGKSVSRTATAAIVLGIVVAASFVASILLTEYDPGTAYFATQVRAWEFGAGALLAFAPAFAAKAVRLHIVASWAGFLLIAAGALMLTRETPFPGYWALIPVVGTILVIGAGSPKGALSTAPLTSLRPVRFLGDISYSVYLWHWPLIVLLPFILDITLGNTAKVGILVASILLGWLSAKFVERPFLRRGSSPKAKGWMPFAGAIAGMALVVGISATGWTTVQNDIDSSIPAARAMVDDVACFGAAARPPGGEPCHNPELDDVAVPLPVAASKDFPALFRGVCEGTLKTDTRVAPCEYGDRDSDVKIALIGDSHGVQYSAALQRIVDANGWAVDIFSKGNCPLSDVRRIGDDIITEACTQWQANAREIIYSGGYDVVVTSQLAGVKWPELDGMTAEETAEAGIVSAWTDLNKHGIPVVAIRDNPRPKKDALACLSSPGVDYLTDCTSKRSTALRFDAQIGAAETMAGADVTLVDFTDIYCTEKRCSPVIGGVTVNRDTNHLTNTFAMTLAPYIAEALPDDLGD